MVERRFRGDIIETYKIVTGKENVNRENFSQMVTELLRGEKIFKRRSRKGLRENIFSQAPFQKIELEKRIVRNERVDKDYRLLYNMV